MKVRKTRALGVNRSRQRRAFIMMEMFIDGATWAEIGRIMGTDGSNAFRSVQLHATRIGLEVHGSTIREIELDAPAARAAPALVEGDELRQPAA